MQVFSLAAATIFSASTILPVQSRYMNVARRSLEAEIDAKEDRSDYAPPRLCDTLIALEAQAALLGQKIEASEAAFVKSCSEKKSALDTQIEYTGQLKTTYADWKDGKADGNQKESLTEAIKNLEPSSA